VAGMRRWSCVIVALLAAEPLAASQNGSAETSDSDVRTAAQLFATPDAMTDGLNVRIEHAVVRAKSGLVLRVVADNHEIFVAPNDPTKLDFLAIGARVNVQGTLHRAPTAPQARLVYAMSRSEARRLAHTRFYIDAWALTASD
jgi:hypothetical protein